MKNPVEEKFAIRHVLAFQKKDILYIKQQDDCLAYKDKKLFTFTCEAALLNMDKSLKFLFGTNNTLRTKENSCLKQDSEGELTICHCDSENTEWIVKDNRLINQNQCL
jgi:hypothetical protein